MPSMTKRITLAVFLTLAVTAASTVLVRAQAPTPGAPQAVPTEIQNCVACHEKTYDMWKGGLHAQAVTDPLFQFQWNQQGNPDACLVCHATNFTPGSSTASTDGITCIACHNPVPANHPKEPMPVDHSADACARCHNDVRFTVEDWQLSAHYMKGIQCDTCHNPHNASMKVLPGNENSTDASPLCENCHKNKMPNFPESVHAKAGITCVNCHLGTRIKDANTAPIDFNSIHAAPDHRFLPSLETCYKCHQNQMHAPGQVQNAPTPGPGTPTPTPQPTIAALATLVTPGAKTPEPASPIGFTGIAIVAGLLIGAVTAPWLGKVYKRVSKAGPNE